MAFDNANRDKVLHASDIVDVVGDHVALRPKGREFAALCCFHDDKSPSMFVSPQKQIFKCFVCGTGGSVFDFVMKYHKMSFPEALRFLADRAGIRLEPYRPQGGRGGGASQTNDDGLTVGERVTAANRQALGFFQTLLTHREHGEAARGYLDRRGVSAEMVERFQLGVAPDRWDGLVQTIGSKGWPVADFELAQLVRPRKSGGGRFDMLRNRLIFPICDAVGRCVAFGGRRLDEEDEPKYLNSPETAVFHKSKTLYGLHLAKKSIIDLGTAVMVEGYTDVVACHQAGATNVVAALGTALTEDHARVLKRFCERVVLVMDGDAAGQRAADRAIEVFLAAEVDVLLASVPGGRDPDELLSLPEEKGGGLAGWDEVIDSAVDALAWQLRVLETKLDDAGSLTGRQKLAEAFVQRVVDAGLIKTKPLRRAMVAERLAELLGVDRPTVDALIRETRPAAARRRSAQPPPASPAPPAPPTQPAPPPGVSAEAATAPVSADVPEDPTHDADEVWAGSGAGPLPGDAAELDFDPGDPHGLAGTSTDNAVDTGLPVAQQRNGAGSVATGPTRSKLAGVAVAERHLIAAFIGDPSLIQCRLADGSELAEALPPGDFTDRLNGMAYQLVTDAICDRRELSLAALLADATAHHPPEQAERLAGRLVRIDEEMSSYFRQEPTAQEKEARVRSAAETILAHHAELDWQRERSRLSDAGQAGQEPADLNDLFAAIRSRTSAIRIDRGG